MAVAFRSISYVAYGNRGGTTITAPAGITDGDVLLLVFFAGSGTNPPPPITLPSGFTQLSGPNFTNLSTFYAHRYLAWKVASGESGNYGISHTSASTTGAIICVSGGETSYPPSHSFNTGFSSTQYLPTTCLLIQQIATCCSQTTAGSYTEGQLLPQDLRREAILLTDCGMWQIKPAWHQDQPAL